MRFQSPRLLATVLAIALCGTSAVRANYVNFESQHVHPIALSLDGKQVYAVNTPDNRLAVFDIVPEGLRLAFEVPVGLEPVSVAVRNHHEVWVANHISDTVSIVDLQARRVRATLTVGDEPTDIVFAGPLRNRAFVCVSQEDAVKIYDPDNLSAAPSVVPLFASDPQAMAVSPDYLTVYVAIFESGNQTTIASEVDVAAHGGSPPPHPPDAPETSLILQYVNGQWQDELGTSYNDTHPYTLPDHDVAVLDASAVTPVPQYFDGLGTLNFNIGVHPFDHRVFVSNTEALNHERFEPVLRGRFAQTRMSIVDPFAPQNVQIVDLNPHIDRSTTPGPQSEINLSLSQPGGMAFDSSGQLIYLTALGSAKVALLDGQANVLDRIDVGPGPSGLALHEAGRRLYVLCRFSNSIDVVDTYKRVLLTSVPMYDPTPAAIRDGRRFLYDARLSSGHGDLACSSCHAGGNLDGIAWDLGDPDGNFVPPPPDEPLLTGFHPLKGPMVTQSLRGLAETEPLHWRGDRAGFSDFNGAFVSLMGRDSPLPITDMQAFEDFIMSIEYAPNPGLQLDGSYPSPASGPNPARGELIFRTELLVTTTCAFCHAQSWGGHHFIINAPAARSTQDVVVPQLRNEYEKTGFDQSPGEKKRGFGYHHDGSVPTLREFLQHPSFDFTGNAQRDDVESFLLHFNTGMPPAVGAQRTFDAATHDDAQDNDWASRMMTIAESGGCDLIVKGPLQGAPAGWLYMGNGLFRSDLNGEAAFTWNDLMQLASLGSPLTVCGVPAGCGMRMGIDRDADGFPDRTETVAGTDPLDPDSRPAMRATDVGPIAGAGRGPLQISSYPNPAPVWKGTTISFALTQRQEVQVHVFDVAGRLVTRLQNGPVGPGLVEIPWDGRNRQQVSVASGKYYYRITTPQGSTSRSLLLVR